MYVLWFHFILDLDFVFLSFLGMVMYDNGLKLRKIQFEPRIKLSQKINIYIYTSYATLSSGILCYGKSYQSLVFSQYTHSPKGSCVY